MGYNQHNAALHYCHFPKSDYSTYKYDMPSRPLSFDTRKDLIDFKKQMEEITGEEYTKAEYLETGYVKKKRRKRRKRRRKAKNK